MNTKEEKIYYRLTSNGEDKFYFGKKTFSNTSNLAKYLIEEDYDKCVSIIENGSNQFLFDEEFDRFPNIKKEVISQIRAEIERPEIEMINEYSKEYC